MRLIPFHREKKQTLHITYIPVLALFGSRTTIWRRSWLAEKRDFFYCAISFFSAFLYIALCFTTDFSLNMLLENYHQHGSVITL